MCFDPRLCLEAWLSPTGRAYSHVTFSWLPFIQIIAGKPCSAPLLFPALSQSVHSVLHYLYTKVSYKGLEFL